MISIAMATYNGAKFLKEQLDSLMTQDRSFDELVICDDCSSDETVKIIQGYSKNDPRIKLYINNHNIGYNKNFQKAISLCSGNYIAICDQDDVWLPNHIKILSDILDTGKILAVGGTKFINENNRFISDKTMAEVRNFPVSHILDNSDIFRFVCYYRNPFQGASMMVRKEFISLFLPLPTSAYLYDVWFTMCASLCNGLKFNPEVISLWRRHQLNATCNVLHHAPVRTLLGHIIKTGSVNNRGELLAELNVRLKEILNCSERKLLDEMINWNDSRKKLSGRIKNAVREYKYWKQIHT